MSFIPQACPSCSSGGGASCCEVTFTGFCLSDGTPIGIVIQEEEQVGWFNLLTGVFTPGAPPVGTGICEDQPVSGFPTATVTSVPSSMSSTTFLVSNPDRREVYIYNNSTSILFVKLGIGASSSSYTFQILAQSDRVLSYPTYTGIIAGAWLAVDGTALITEVTS